MWAGARRRLGGLSRALPAALALQLSGQVALAAAGDEEPRRGGRDRKPQQKFDAGEIRDRSGRKLGPASAAAAGPSALAQGGVPHISDEHTQKLLAPFKPTICSVQGTQTTEVQRLLSEGLVLAQLPATPFTGIEQEVAKLSRNDPFWAEGSLAGFLGAKEAGIAQRGALVCAGLHSAYYAAGHVGIAYTLLSMHLLNKQNALNYSFYPSGPKGDKMHAFFLEASAAADANAWGSPLPAGDPQANGMQVAPVKAQSQWHLEPEKPEPRCQSASHTDGRLPYDKLRCGLSLVSGGAGASAGAFAVRDGGVQGAVSELKLQHLSLYGCSSDLRRDGHVRHYRRLGSLAVDGCVFCPLEEVDPQNFPSLVYYLPLGVALLREIEFTFPPVSKCPPPPGGWWGKTIHEAEILAWCLERSRASGLLYAQVPAALAYTVNLSKSVSRCLSAALMAGWKGRGDHRLALTTTEGIPAGTVSRVWPTDPAHLPYHICPGDRRGHPVDCRIVTLTTLEVASMTSEAVAQQLRFNSIESAHRFLAKNNVFLTLDWRKVNDHERLHSCAATRDMIMQSEAEHGKQTTRHPKMWIRRTQADLDANALGELDEPADTGAKSAARDMLEEPEERAAAPEPMAASAKVQRRG